MYHPCCTSATIIDFICREVAHCKINLFISTLDCWNNVRCLFCIDVIFLVPQDASKPLQITFTVQTNKTREDRFSNGRQFWNDQQENTMNFDNVWGTSRSRFQRKAAGLNLSDLGNFILAFNLIIVKHMCRPSIFQITYSPKKLLINNFWIIHQNWRYYFAHFFAAILSAIFIWLHKQEWVFNCDVSMWNSLLLKRF